MLSTLPRDHHWMYMQTPSLLSTLSPMRTKLQRLSEPSSPDVPLGTPRCLLTASDNGCTRPKIMITHSLQISRLWWTWSSTPVQLVSCLRRHAGRWWLHSQAQWRSTWCWTHRALLEVALSSTWHVVMCNQVPWLSPWLYQLMWSWNCHHWSETLPAACVHPSGAPLYHIHWLAQGMQCRWLVLYSSSLQTIWQWAQCALPNLSAFSTAADSAHQNKHYGEAFQAGRGMTQGDVVSCKLFNITVDAVIAAGWIQSVLTLMT